MTQEKRDIIYNKTANELSKEEAEYIQELINKKYKKMACINFWSCALVGPIAGCLIPLLVLANPITEYFTIAPITTIVGMFSGLLLGGIGYSWSSPITLKSLGLTRNDWKELKKSGRLKELKNLIEEYNKIEVSIESNNAIESESRATDAQVEEMLAYEANLLVRTAERIQQSKQMIIDMDENSSNEVGKKLINLNRAINELNSILPENSISD